jgi:hypothetical protein
MGSIASFGSVGVTVAPAAFAAAAVPAEGTTSGLLTTDHFKRPGLTNSSTKRLMTANRQGDGNWRVRTAATNGFHHRPVLN